MRRHGISSFVPMLLVLAVLTSSLATSLTLQPLFTYDQSTKIEIVVSSKITYKTENGTLAEAPLYKYIVSVQSPSPLPYGGKFIQPLYYRIEPNQTITASMSSFMIEWRKHISKIIDSLKNKKSTLVPIIYIEIIGIGTDGKHYVARKIITNYDVWSVIHKTKGLDVSYSDFVINNPIAVLDSGLTFKINVSEITFTRSRSIIIEDNSGYSVTTKANSQGMLMKSTTGVETTSACTLYNPYDKDALACYLVGDQGIIPGSSFAADSPWYLLYQQRYSPPESWYNHIVVPPDLDKNDVVQSAWYQFAVGFSSVYYVKVSAFGSRSQALAALENLASAYVVAEGVHTLGDGQYTGFISLLYSINKNSYHYWGISWANSKMGTSEVVTEPLGILYLNKTGDVPYQPSVTFSVAWARMSIYTNILEYADVVSIVTSTVTITEEASKSLAIGYTQDNFNYAVIVWDVNKVYGPDVATVYHDIITAYDGLGNEYLVLIPHVAFDVIEYKTPYTETIRYYKNEMLNEYILPYDRGYLVELTRGELSVENEVSTELMFLMTDNYSKYELIARPENVIKDVVSWVIGSVDNTGYASLVLMFIKYLSFAQTASKSEQDFMTVTIVVHDLAGFISGAVTAIYHKQPLILSSGESAIGGIYQVYTTYQSSIPFPCDPVTGNCIT